MRFSRVVRLLAVCSIGLASVGCSADSPTPTSTVITTSPPLSSYQGLPADVTTQYYSSKSDSFAIGFPVLKTSSGNSPIIAASNTTSDGAPVNGYMSDLSVATLGVYSVFVEGDLHPDLPLAQINDGCHGQPGYKQRALSNFGGNGVAAMRSDCLKLEGRQATVILRYQDHIYRIGADHADRIGSASVEQFFSSFKLVG
ncbi:MAG TPA: hypothetical protein VLI05_01045 [Candidatus Saccharimonadia bacterium]|nr:hypothetical protein [Candidatus Saccharimonadia bacterium]